MPVVTGGDREREGNEPNADDKSVGPSAAPNENKSDRKSTASASAKLLLRGVRDSADAFGPLKSVAGGLCFILENCEVWSPSPDATHNTHRRRSVRRQTKKRSNPWHPGSKRLPGGSVNQFLRVMSRSEKGERYWNCKPMFPKDKDQV